MCRDAALQILRAIAAFEQRHEAAAAVALGKVSQAQRQRAKILRFQPQPRERIVPMAVEARAKDQEVRREVFERRRDALAPGRAKSFAAVAFDERRIDDIAVLALLQTAPVPGKSGI